MVDDDGDDVDDVAAAAAAGSLSRRYNLGVYVFANLINCCFQKTTTIERDVATIINQFRPYRICVLVCMRKMCEVREARDVRKEEGR